MVIKSNFLYFWDWKLRMILIFWTVLKGLNSCYSVLFFVFGVKLYINMYYFVLFRVLLVVVVVVVGISVLVVLRMDLALRGEYLKC